MKSTYIELVLTCGSWQEAHKIADALLEKRLIACAEFLPIQSRYLWKQSVAQADEIKLIMQSVARHFEAIENLIKELHSYETPSLHAMPVTYATSETLAWLEHETNTKDAE